MAEISVIIPNYNHASYLEERIHSILEQTFQDFELIILDDASTDDSRNIIESLKDHRNITKIIYNNVNSGSPFRQWAKGIEYAKSKWIWIAESDDTASPQFLEKMIAASGSQPAFVFCDSLIGKPGSERTSFAAIKNKRYNTEKWSHPFIADGKKEINDTLKWECTVNNASAVLFNRQLLNGVLNKIVDYKYHGDWMLYLLLAEKAGISYIPETLNNYREHEKNHSNSDEYQRQFKIEHFRILDHLLNQDFVTDKNELFRHFLEHYTGFGFLKEPGFGQNGIYQYYKKINRQLAARTVRSLLLNKFKKKRTG